VQQGNSNIWNNDFYIEEFDYITGHFEKRTFSIETPDPPDMLSIKNFLQDGVQSTSSPTLLFADTIRRFWGSTQSWPSDDSTIHFDFPLLDKSTLKLINNRSFSGFWYGQGWAWSSYSFRWDRGIINDNFHWCPSTSALLSNGELLVIGRWQRYIGSLDDLIYWLPSSLDDSHVMTACAFNSSTLTWRELGQAQRRRWQASFAEMQNGKVLVSGGNERVYPNPNDDGGVFEIPVPEAELYDMQTGQFALTGSMNQPRIMHASLALPDGRILIAGGYLIPYIGPDTGLADLLEVYDPTTGAFDVIEKLTYGIAEPKLIINKDGRVFMLGRRIPLSPDSIDGTASALTRSKASSLMASGPDDPGSGPALVEIKLKPREIPVRVLFPKFWPDSNGVYDFAKRPVPTIAAECVKVAITDATGERWSGYTDESGRLTIPLEGNSNPASFLVSETGKTFNVVLKPETKVEFGGSAIARASVKRGLFRRDANGNIPPPVELVFPIKTLIGGDKNLEDSISYTAKDSSVDREAGSINMLWVYRKALKYLGVAAAPRLDNFQFWWDPSQGDDGITRFDSSLGSHVYVRANRSVNADDFDDGVLLHELGHKVHKEYGPYRPMPSFGG
jgi:hypothetical protein